MGAFADWEKKEFERGYGKSSVRFFSTKGWGNSVFAKDSIEGV